MKLSIIVPVYKTINYLDRCITSILAQSFTDFELILVDDGSPDDCGKICDSYKEKDSRVIVVHKENSGVSSARNYGIEVAQGNWCMFVDSDDALEADYLEKIIPPTDYADLIISGFCNTYEDGKKAYGYLSKTNQFIKHEYYTQFVNNTFFKFHYLVVGGKLFKTQIIKKKHLKFDESLSIVEDAPFVYQYLKFADSIATSNNCGYIFYSRNNEGKKYQLPAPKAIEQIQMIMHLLEDLKKYKGIQNERVSHYYPLYFFRLYSNYLCQDNRYNNEKKENIRSIIQNEFISKEIYSSFFKPIVQAILPIKGQLQLAILFCKIKFKTHTYITG